MKIDCEKNINTFISSKELLLDTMKSIMASGLEILQVSKCNEDGYHIFTEKKNERKD